MIEVTSSCVSVRMRVPQSYPNGGCWIVKVHKGVGVLGKLWQDLVSEQ